MRRRVHLVATVVLALALVTTGCSPASGTGTGSDGEPVIGSGALATDTRDLPAFSAVELRTVGTVVVEPGASARVRIEGDDNLVPLVSTGVARGRLVIAWKPGVGSVTATHPITYHLVSAGDLTELDVRGAGAIQLGSMQGAALRLGVNGLGHIAVDRVDAREVIARISGAGQITTAGQAEHQRLTIDGMGAYRADGLASRQADVTITGAGNALLRVSDVLNTTIDGVGIVRYAGDPRITRHGDGLGQVVPASGQ